MEGKHGVFLKRNVGLICLLAGSLQHIRRCQAFLRIRYFFNQVCQCVCVKVTFSYGLSECKKEKIIPHKFCLLVDYIEA